jgi:hypothetical protein
MVNIATRVPPLVNRGVLPHEVQIFTNFGGSQAMVLMVDLAMTVADLKMLFMNTPAVRRVLYNIEGFNPDKIKFYISDRTLALEEHLPLLIYNVAANDTIRARYLLVGGMPKKGCKKTIAKVERLAVLSARVQHQASQLQQPGNNALLQQVSNIGYTEQTLGQLVTNMNFDQVQNMQQASNNENRRDKVGKAVMAFFVPQIQQMTQQRDELNRAIGCLQEGFQLGFANRFCTDDGWEIDAFDKLVQDSINAIVNQRQQNQHQQDAQNLVEAEVQRRLEGAQNQVEAEVQRRLAAMGPAPDGGVDMDI